MGVYFGKVRENRFISTSYISAKYISTSYLSPTENRFIETAVTSWIGICRLSSMRDKPRIDCIVAIFTVENRCNTSTMQQTGSAHTNDNWFRGDGDGDVDAANDAFLIWCIFPRLVFRWWRW